MNIDEWQTRLAVRLDGESVAILRQRFSVSIEVRPSWDHPGTFDLTAAGYIGAIALPKLSLFLQPKVPLNTAIYMLARADALPLLESEKVLMPDAPLSEVLAHWFSGLAGPIVDRHLVRRYQAREAAGTFVRGAIDIPTSIRLHARGIPSLYCRYDDFTPDIPENIIIRSAAQSLLKTPGVAAKSMARLHRINAMLAEVSEGVLPRWRRKSIVLDRLNNHYRDTLQLAEWILERASPEVDRRDGARQFPAFLVDMASVFERFVTQGLAERLHRLGLVAITQQGRWLDSGERLFRTRPDLVISDPEGRCIVLDTKYKRFGEQLRPSEADVYQLITYCVTRHAHVGILLYPSLDDQHFIARVADHHLSLAFISVPLNRGRIALEHALDGLAHRLADWLRVDNPL